MLKIDLFKSFLKLQLNKFVTDLVLNEIRESGIDQVHKAIDDGELNLVQFDDEDLFEIQTLKIKYPALSLQDCSCLFTAKAISVSLLTGEKKLTSISKQYKIEVHGILWVFDQMISERAINQRIALKKLSQLMGLNERLPEAECKKRLELWAKN
jgi:predicted nucleic acid-binding protein